MKRTFLFLIVVISFLNILSAQERTHLPYSIYGLGDQVPRGFSHSISMGHTGIALSSPTYLNNVNPASYHMIDSLSFFFDFGLYGNFVKYRTDINPSQHGKDINIANMAIGFSLTKNWKSSVGIAPFSLVGYKIQTRQSILGAPSEEYDVIIQGNGGLNQFYWNNSYKLFNHISLGASVTYLFGSIESTETAQSAFAGNIVLKETKYLKKLFADFGLQAWYSPAENWDLTIGGIFGQGHNIGFTKKFSLTDETGPGVDDEQITDEGTFKLPMYFGAGFSVIYKNSLTLTGDYVYRDWSSTESGSTDFKYHSNNAYRFGLQIIPGRFSQLGYFGGMAYRAGAYYEESYLELNGRLIPEYGITAGLGLPFLQNRTSVNISYNYGIKGTLENHFVKERYHTVMFSITMHDWWFLKRKID